MSSTQRILTALAGILGRVLTTQGRRRPSASDRGGARQSGTRTHAVLRLDGTSASTHPGHGDQDATGRMPGAQTVQVDPERVRDVSVGYSPSRNDQPDSGEVIWTWVPYAENDGRGKDRPVLVIGRQSADRVYAVRMTSRPHDGDRDFLAIGSGSWDSQGRESWVDIEQLYSVHHRGMRREAAVLDARRYGRVADALIRRYGWAKA